MKAEDLTAQIVHTHRLLTRLGFAGLDAIIRLVHPENAASIRALETCGLRYADQFRLWGMELCRYPIRLGIDPMQTNAD